MGNAASSSGGLCSFMGEDTLSWQDDGKTRTNIEFVKEMSAIKKKEDSGGPQRDALMLDEIALIKVVMKTSWGPKESAFDHFSGILAIHSP